MTTKTNEFSNVKKSKKSRFGKALKIEDASGNLEQPEHAPKEPEELKTKKKVIKKSVRTVPFGFRVSDKFLKEFKLTALQYDLKQVELLEACLQAFKDTQNKK